MDKNIIYRRFSTVNFLRVKENRTMYEKEAFAIVKVFEIWTTFFWALTRYGSTLSIELCSVSLLRLHYCQTCLDMCLQKYTDG